MSVIAKMQVVSAFQATPGSDLVTVEMIPVYSNDPNDINKAFNDATPSGHCKLNIQEDKPAAKYFEVGDEVLINFTKIEKKVQNLEEPVS